jgi:hypothetical protein
VKPPQAVLTDPSATETTSGHTKNPDSEPNPYDIKLEDEASAPKPPPAQSSGSNDAASSEASGDSGSQAPGF